MTIDLQVYHDLGTLAGTLDVLLHRLDALRTNCDDDTRREFDRWVGGAHERARDTLRDYATRNSVPGSFLSLHDAT